MTRATLAQRIFGISEATCDAWPVTAQSAPLLSQLRRRRKDWIDLVLLPLGGGLIAGAIIVISLGAI